MAKKTKGGNKDKGKDRHKDKAVDSERSSSSVVNAGVRVALAMAAVVAVGAGLYVLRERLLASPPYSDRFVRIRLAARPAWLPSDIAAKVTAGVQAAVGGRSVFDDRLAGDVNIAAAGSAWVAKVRRVSKHQDGDVIIDVEFRRPFALAATEKAPGAFHVVDAEGVVLPLRPGRITPGALVVIDGVAAEPPEAGGKWDAPDLTAGLRLGALIGPKPYASQITIIDVRNHDGRRDPLKSHLLMYAQVGRGRRTDIRFGRFPTDDLDTCRRPDAKLAMLDGFVERNGGRLAGVREWVDIRHDRIHVSIN